MAALAIAVLPAGPGGVSRSRSPRDAEGREVTVTDTSRVLSIGGSVTEILYALGLEENIAAVDTTSVYPPEALATKHRMWATCALCRRKACCRSTRA